METERLILDSIKESDKEDYFVNISHDRKVLETFICRYAETMEDLDFSSYPGRSDLFAVLLKETGRLIGVINFFDETLFFLGARSISKYTITVYVTTPIIAIIKSVQIVTN